MDENWELEVKIPSESLEKHLRRADVLGITQHCQDQCLCVVLAPDGLAFLEFFTVP